VTHPHCHGPEGHVCEEPSGRTCVETDCDQPAGTLWGPLWCPAHDEERLNRVSGGIENLLARFKGEAGR
jgi:hypothetical protein